jgi:hypothetical protein
LSGTALAQPPAAIPVSPVSDVVGSTIAFSWQSASGATWYQLWLGRPDTSLVSDQWYTAEHAGCSSGGTCTVTMTAPLIAGPYTWYVRTWAPNGYGPWSSAHLFTVKDPTQAWSGTLPPSRRFTLVLNNAAALDNETGLVWARTPHPDAIRWSWTLAVCAMASTGGRYGWRVPTLAELRSLFVPGQSNPALPPGHPFMQLGTNPYLWSRTPNIQATNSYHATHVDTGSLFAFLNDPSVLHRVLCVRGGTAPEP